MKKNLSIFLFFALVGFGPLMAQETESKTYTQQIKSLTSAIQSYSFSFRLPAGVKIDTLIIHDNEVVSIGFNGNLSYFAFRENEVQEFYSVIPRLIKSFYPVGKLTILVDGKELSSLVPNMYRNTLPIDTQRLPKMHPNRNLQVVKNNSKPYVPVQGLGNNNIILWHSHGWYYNDKMLRWEWQRPRLFTCVEDLLPLSFTIPYIIPMLENAGANVYVPRERDIQVHEVVVDNDRVKGKVINGYKEINGRFSSSAKNSGFLWHEEYDSNENPFRMGTYRIAKAGSKAAGKIIWNPEIPETGEYAVYISYQALPENSAHARYTVYHAGGNTEFTVNQQIGGSSWYYLGTFRFRKGNRGRVELACKTVDGKSVTADAVRFGGGMGNIKRAGAVSGRARFLEGARYWLQYAGMPDSLVYKPGKGGDYTDDYQSRAEYGNYLSGAPFGPTNAPQAGLGVPVHLSLAFHTDAGITKNDSVIGTLSIYSSKSFKGSPVFGDSVSRMASRDFADILQTEIVGAIKREFDPNWVRRQLRDAEYSESTRPAMPGALLELLSHQNFKDMQYALDPSFRFTVSRAIYKSMVKYLATSEGRQYTIQPLPVQKSAALLQPDGSIKVIWEMQTDSTEPTAVPDGYIVYQRLQDGGFDNGTLVKDTFFRVQKPAAGTLYSFKIAAVNKGGESMPSEIVCAGKVKNGRQTLVVNGFTRTATAGRVEVKGFAGFADFLDEGVADKYTVSYTGPQYSFSDTVSFKTNDTPGHGASNANYEGVKITGNSFDNIYTHGIALLQAGCSFSSCAEAALPVVHEQLKDVALIDLLYGEQKETVLPKNSSGLPQVKRFGVFPESTRAVLAAYLSKGGALFVSGAYISSDVFTRFPKDSLLQKFVHNYLHYQYQSAYASKTGAVTAGMQSVFGKDFTIKFQTEFSPERYKVEAPDAIQPAKGAEACLMYQENSFTAAVFTKSPHKVIACGFPFESVILEKERTAFMRAVVKQLLQ